MRLPRSEHGLEGIDVEESIRLLRHAIDNGVNYFDTAYTYNEGGSEKVLAMALKDGYGDKVMVATKLPTMRLLKPEEHQEFLETSLQRLERDYIDFYLLHGMKERYWPIVQQFDTASFMVKKREEGLVKNIGFAYHGETFGLFKEILDSAPWDFVQLQFNYMDEHFQAGVEGLRYAGSKGVAVIIMEPLKGGKLTNNIPPSILQRMDSLDVKRSPAAWGLKWVANHPEVTTILSGMSTFEQLEENLQILSDAEPGCLKENEIALIGEIAEEYRTLIPYQCTSCGYCRRDCPEEIEIPLIIGMRNDASMFNTHAGAKFEISHMIRKPPSLCIGCKKCEEICPQHLKVSEIMKECAELYEDESLQYWRDYTA